MASLTRRRPAFLAIAVLALAGQAAAQAPSTAQTLSPAKPEALGLSSERLRRLSAVMKRYMDEGRVAGVVTLVARGGRLVHLEAVGQADREAGVPMRADTIFRIASMSKGVTSVAAMILIEEGRLGLADPVSKYIPSFKKTTVFVAPPAGAVPGTPLSAVPAKREINVRDLLTHTSGISYGAGPVEALYKAANVQGWYFADKAEPVSAAVDRLAALPFEAQPGEKYVYGFSTDVLGVVVEKASGLSLDEFFRTRIFEPLGMTDTHFYLPPAKKGRLAAVYAAKEGAALERAPDAGTGQGAYVDGPRQAFSGGAGLLSTARDYARFLQALLDGGELDGARILGPKTVELMTSNHVGSLHNEGRTGFGLGFEVVEHLGRAGRFGSVGDFGWGGAYFTSYWADPQEQLVAVFMCQLLPSGGLDLQSRFRTLVYQAIVAPAPGHPISRAGASRD
jgi:CubicO group peptidase (beta-lactamase class C family)